jgi:hypothetical protein
MKNTSIYVINGLFMTFLWFILRVCLFAWLGVRIFSMRSDVLTLTSVQRNTVLFSYFVGYSLQLFWFNKILRGALKAIGIGTKKESKKAH